MQYMGSKNRISKDLLPIILKDKKEEQFYVEPFVGGANMIDKIGGNRIGADNNKYLISMWQELQKGWTPPTNISQEDYTNIRINKEKHPAHLVCFVGFLCAFGGKWFGGYAKNKKGDNYADRGSRVLTKQIKNLQDVKFINCSYKDLDIPNESIIYCDPPYAGTTKYKDGFNHEEFWEWCRDMTKTGHQVFISEYNAPNDFICVFEKEVKTVLNKNAQTDKRIEKLFVYAE